MNSPAKLVQPIHFEDWDGKQFERLVLAYHIRSENWHPLEWYGQTGSDMGRDIWGVRRNEASRDESICIQCANRRKFSATKAIQAIDKILTSPSGRPDIFRFVCASSFSAKSRDRIKAHAARKGIKKKNCEIWSGNEFEERLRSRCESLLARFISGESFPDSPDQMAEVVRVDNQINLEWAHNNEYQRLGRAVTVECVNLVDPPPPPPPRQFSTAEIMAIGEVLRQMIHSGSIAKLIEQKHPTPTMENLTINLSPSDEEIREYTKARAMFAPLRIWLKNLGLRNASSVKVKICIPKMNGIRVVAKYDLPEKSWDQGIGITEHWSSSHNTHIKEYPDSWQVEIDAKNIQPQDQFWSDCFYISVMSDQTIEMPATIFADNSKPIEVSLKIHVRVLTRETTLHDIDSGA